MIPTPDNDPDGQCFWCGSRDLTWCFLDVDAHPGQGTVAVGCRHCGAQGPAATQPGAALLRHAEILREIHDVPPRFFGADYGEPTPAELDNEPQLPDNELRREDGGGEGAVARFWKAFRRVLGNDQESLGQWLTRKTHEAEARRKNQQRRAPR